MARMNTSIISRIQSLSPRKRTNGIWLMIGSENGIRNSTTTAMTATTFLVTVGSICASALVGRVEVGAQQHAQTLRISGVPNRPYGRTSRPMIITTYGTISG